MVNSSVSGDRRQRSSALRLAPLGILAALVGCTGPAGPTVPTGDPSDEQAGRDAGYALAIRGGGHRIAELAQPVNLSIDISRDPEGYAGPITFVVEAPEGIIVGFRPATVLHDFTNVILIAEADVEPRDHQVVFHGTAPGYLDQTVTLTLSLRPKS